MSDVPPIKWRKSSRSSQEGGDCVEVAAIWRKSSQSGQEGTDCVEVADLDHAIDFRDSKDPEGARLTLGRAGWRALSGAIKSAQYDL